MDCLERLDGGSPQFGSFSAGKLPGPAAIGLAISEQLAELHGGSLSLESKLGVGSTFSLTLPCTGATNIQKTA